MEALGFDRAEAHKVNVRFSMRVRVRARVEISVWY